MHYVIVCAHAFKHMGICTNKHCAFNRRNCGPCLIFKTGSVT